MASDRNKIVAAASRCLSCESSRSALMGAIANGFQSCCPDCDTLTLHERNKLRELLDAALAAERARVVAELRRRRAQGGPTSYDTDESSLAYTDALGEMIEWMEDTTAAARGTGEG